jgi:hypothetical protein
VLINPLSCIAPHSILLFLTERNIARGADFFFVSFLISSTQEITRQRKIPLRAQYSAQWKTGLTPEDFTRQGESTGAQ